MLCAMILKFQSLLWVASLLLVGNLPALAHGGHGTTASNQASHWFLEPLHLGMLVATGSLVWLAVRGLRAPQTARVPARGKR